MPTKQDLERLRKRKRLMELEARRSQPSAEVAWPTFREQLQRTSSAASDVDPATGLILRPLTEQTTADLTLGPSKEALLRALETPFRGTRGIGVGALKLARTGSPSEAVMRANEAIQTGFQPEGFTETIVSGMSEAAPILPALAAGGGAGALAAGAQNLLRQSAEEDSVSPGGVAASALLGALAPAGAKGAVKTGKVLLAPGKEAAELGVQKALPVDKNRVIAVANEIIKNPLGKSAKKLQVTFERLVDAGNDAAAVYGDDLAAATMDRAIAKEIAERPGISSNLKEMAKKVSSAASKHIREIYPAGKKALEAAQNQMLRSKLPGYIAKGTGAVTGAGIGLALLKKLFKG